MTTSLTGRVNHEYSDEPSTEETRALTRETYMEARAEFFLECYGLTVRPDAEWKARQENAHKN